MVRSVREAVFWIGAALLLPLALTSAWLAYRSAGDQERLFNAPTPTSPINGQIVKVTLPVPEGGLALESLEDGRRQRVHDFKLSEYIFVLSPRSWVFEPSPKESITVIGTWDHGFISDGTLDRLIVYESSHEAQIKDLVSSRSNQKRKWLGGTSLVFASIAFIFVFGALRQRL